MIDGGTIQTLAAGAGLFAIAWGFATKAANKRAGHRAAAEAEHVATEQQHVLDEKWKQDTDTIIHGRKPNPRIGDPGQEGWMDQTTRLAQAVNDLTTNVRGFQAETNRRLEALETK